jgi:hypothetical protein
MESKDIFATICYLVLMDHHGDGFIEAHPAYIGEKHRMMQEGWSAFGRLDIENMRRVMDWCRAWKCDLPEIVTSEFNRQQDAERSLRDKGFNL